MEQVRVIVRGRVQGVWYRQSCRDRAEAAGLSGWVRNSPDGSVEAVVEGDGRAVAALVAWMREGPPAAVVTDVEVVREAPTGESGFSIR